VTSGVYTVAIGQNAGSITSTGTNTTYCDQSIFIGSRSKPLSTSSTNEIVIGESAVGLGSNTAVLGNASITTTALRGNVGIGTTAPSSKLHVEGASPTVLIKNSSASGFGTLSFSNTIAVSGNDIWQNGSTQAGYGGPSSLNIQASSGPLAFHTGTVTNALSIAQSGNITAGRIILNTLQVNTIINSNDSKYFWEFSNSSEVATFARLQTAPIMQFAGTTSSFPALKRSGATLQTRLADDSAFAPIQGKLTTDTAYTGTTVVPTGFITLYDSIGTAYKVPCVAA
jgi:hypothetical protein